MHIIYIDYLYMSNFIVSSLQDNINHIHQKKNVETILKTKVKASSSYSDILFIFNLGADPNITDCSNNKAGN